MAKEKTCKNCGQSVDKKAVVCTSCGVKIKKPIFKKWWFWVIIVVAVIAIASSGGNDSENNIENNTNTQQTSQTETIEYTPYSVSELVNDLEENALKAEEKYKDKYVEITGKLSVIDSKGKYISLSPTDNDFCLTNVQCYIKNDEQKSKVLEVAKGDTLTIKGKIKSVGEVLGYSLDIDSIN